MMFLKPDGKIDLEYRAFLGLRGTPFRSVVVAAAQDGQLSILSPDLKSVQSCRLPSKVRAISPHPSDQRLAWVDERTGLLSVQDFRGTRLLEIAPLRAPETRPEVIHPGFDDCCYSEDGCYLWTVAPSISGDVMVQLHDAETGVTLEHATIKDPFGGSSCSFHPTARPDLLSVWLAAGNPDMVQVFWLKRTCNGFSCTLESRLGNTIPPVFSPSGDQFLVLREDFAICKFDFPTMQQIGLPLYADEDEDNPFTESLCYLNDRQALAGTNEQRIFVVDTDRMEVEAEVSLEGHEPRPVGEYYPSLAKEQGLGTDISYFTRLGDVIFFVYRRDRGTGLAGRKDGLLYLSAKSGG
jgi:hypothetical protein